MNLGRFSNQSSSRSSASILSLSSVSSCRIAACHTYFKLFVVIVLGCSTAIIWKCSQSRFEDYLSAGSTIMKRTSANSIDNLSSTIMKRTSANSIDNLSRAVVHVGPHKTATTSTQRAINKMTSELLTDGYETPRGTLPRSVSSLNDSPFAACFQKGREKRCNQEMYQSAVAISKRKSGLLVTSEELSRKSIYIESLSIFLKPWSDVKILVSYRRFYDWLVSWYFQSMRGWYSNGKNGMRTQIVDWLSSTKKVKKIWDDTYTVSVVKRYKEYFDNVAVMNFHNDSDNIEDFFCVALPGAKNACQSAKALPKETSNSAHPLVYKDMAFFAKQEGLVKFFNNNQLMSVANLIMKNQEQTMNLTISDFPMKCLPFDMKKYLLEISLDAEKELFPDFFETPLGEAALRLEFESAARNKLCSVDIQAVLEKESWKEFFSTF